MESFLIKQNFRKIFLQSVGLFALVDKQKFRETITKPGIDAYKTSYEK